MTANLGWRQLPQGWMAYDESASRCIAGFGWNWCRPWIYPLYTPAGRQVLQEFPFDHPFHNGCFTGIHPVIHGDRSHNFWATPPQRSVEDSLLQNLGRVTLSAPPELSVVRDELHALLQLEWTGCHGEPLLYERRSLRIQSGGIANQIHIHCHLTACVALTLPRTKFAGVGVRLDPALSALGEGRYAQVWGLRKNDLQAVEAWVSSAKSVLDVSACDATMLHGQALEAACFESAKREGGYGLLIHEVFPKVPWFVRDYGLVLLNALQMRDEVLSGGDSFTWTATLAAYDR